jgi:hypothetical protein
MIIVEGLDLDLNLSLDLGQAQIDETDVEDVEARHQVLKREEADIKKIKTVNILKIKKRRSIKSINVDLLQILSHDK